VVYLPGVSRQAFRGAPGFPDVARHLFACQYHPEKSGSTGLQMLKNFAAMVAQQAAAGVSG
jgi:GMP synthase-like glutamine amidotransferase